MAYSAVISAKHTIQHLLNLTDPQINEIAKSAYDELKSLGNTLNRLDGSSNRSNRSAIDALDAEIRDAVWKLEDVVESYMLYHSLTPSDSSVAKSVRLIPKIDERGMEQGIISFLKRVKMLKLNHYREQQMPSSTKEDDVFSPTMVGLDIESVLMSVEKFEDKYITELENSLPGEEDDVVSPVDDDFGGSKSTSVGLLDQSKKLRSELLNRKPGLKVVSLVGMAGIGKTFLARKIYKHRSIVRHFDSKAWVRVGPKDQIKDALVDIVAQIECKPINLYMGKDMHTLGTLLQKSLHQRKYLIVLDDIWNTRFCNTLRWWLPADGIGKRLLLTTRIEEVAQYLNTSIHQMRFLNSEESWILLRKNVFSGNFVPYDLKKAGRKIAENCEGLPLLILTVANILYGFEKTEEYWMKVADKQTTTFTNAYDKIYKVLSSSYEYLPQYLKACFFYMGVFPQSYEIPLSKLVNLWTVEDFLEPNKSQTLEDFAVECLEKLVSQSLVIGHKHISNYQIKSSKLHSAYWHLCVIEARKNRFLHVLNCFNDGFHEHIESQRRLSVQNNILFGIKEVYNSMAAALRVRSLLCTGQYLQYPVPMCFDLMLLKVLDALAIRFYEFPNEVLKLLQLRYLALTHNGNLPSFISKLQNLQSLIVSQHHNIKLLKVSTSLPKEIWDMQKLRHLQIMGSNLPDPSNGAQLPNLFTLYVKGHSCTKDVFRSIPKLKKLGIKIELQPRSAEILSCFEHISILQKLESLKCVVVNPRVRSQVVAPPDSNSRFPESLKKLSLNGIGYSWKHMSAIGSLPNLQVLKLRHTAFRGPEWETKVEEFPRLKFLVLEDIDLVLWEIAGDDCFPSLQDLIIRHCYKLRKIPLQIAIQNLERVEIVDCSPSVVDYAQILQDRRNSPQVVIKSSWDL